LNCFHHTDDIRGAKLNRKKAAIHHQRGDSQARSSRSTNASAPTVTQQFSTVTTSAAVPTLTTRLTSAMSAPRKGRPVQVPRTSGWPVFHTNWPAA
jgi:hypothetical protein